MELFLSKIASSILQIAIFTAIPLIWWIISARKQTSFFHWIGLKKVPNTKKGLLYKWIVITAAAFIFLSLFILFMLSGVKTATSTFRGLGISALPAAMVYAFFNTALPEEILFRGFLLKRLSGKFGFKAGNIVQSILFGALHGIMFISLTGVVKAILIVLFTGAIGWCMGYLNEKQAEGSILPSWLIHGIANTFSAAISLFSII